MAKDKIPAPNPGTEGTHDEAFRDDDEKEGQLARGNRSLQDDKSVGENADHGQRGSQGGQKRPGRKG